MEKVLDIKNIKVAVSSTNDWILDDVSLDVNQKEIVGIVGGSGSGKSTLAMATLGLLHQALSFKQGQIIFNLVNIASNNQASQHRGKDIGYVFQEPLQAFNPVMTIGQQIQETIQTHLNLDEVQAKEKTLDLLITVGIKENQRIYDSYSFQLSGGLRQRAMIAQAICCDPKLIIADEPTSNLDVTLQVKILELFKHLRDRLGLSIIFISHDLPLVHHLADRIYVMHKGKVVESGASDEVMNNPQDEYTKQLMNAIGDI